MIFFDAWLNPPVCNPEPGGGEQITEMLGYVEPKKKIEEFIMAGIRLQQARDDQYDYTEETDVDDAEIDPTRDSNYDLADASQAMLRMRNNVVRQDAVQQQMPGTDGVVQASKGEPAPKDSGKEG